MNKDSERRKNNRVSIVWKVIVNQNEEVKSYVRDFSKNGMRLWLNMINGFIIQKLSIQIPYPQKPYLLPLQLETHPVWIKNYDNLQFCELGCKIDKLNVHQEMQLIELINLFRSANRIEELEITHNE